MLHVRATQSLVVASGAYLNPDWLPTLRYNQAEHFEQLWQLNQGDWFEPPNYRRGGWSGVTRTRLLLSGDGEVGVFIKRQENHIYRAWENLFFPVSTFAREFKNILRFHKLGIPTLELVYFGQRKHQGNQQAILVTRELEGFLPLDDEKLQSNLKSNMRLRKLVIVKIAEALRHMHNHHMQHNCLYPKHLFIKALPDHSVELRLIDLEKVKWKMFRRQAMQRDLGTLHRHAEGWSKSDRLRLFLAYRQEQRLSVQSRKFLHSL